MSEATTLEQFALRWLQHQLSEILVRGGAPECAFPADLPLRELPGDKNTRQLFAELSHRGLRLPALFLSSFQFVLITLISLGLLVTSILSGLPVEQVGAVIFFGLVVWVVRLIFAQRFFAMSTTARTVGELSEQLLYQNPLFFTRLSGIPLSREQIKRIVIRVLAETTGVDRSEITEETALVDLVG